MPERNPPTSTAPLHVDVHVTQAELAAIMRTEVRAGLTSSPRELQPKWFYDDVGCELFDAITRLPEYYPTRREREILYSEAGAVARLTEADTMIELGPGSGEKTLLLLDALAGRGTLSRFVPFDVSELWVRSLAETTVDRYRGVEAHGVVGDFERHLDRLPGGGRRLIAFLGSTIGNLTPGRRKAFLVQLAGSMTRNDHLLLGADLVKDIARLEAAYDDAAGTTALFNLNMLSVLNRELGADFSPGRFEHVARWSERDEWVEMLLRSRCDQRVTVHELGLSVDFAGGELMRTEISAKFRPAELRAELGEVGFEAVRFWTDSHQDFSLVLARLA